MTKKAYAIILLLLFPILTSLSTSPSFAAPTTTLSVEPQIQTGLEIDEQFTINITVTNVTDLYGWQFALYYKSSILNGTGYAEGPFLKKDGTQTFFQVVEFTDNYNETHGKIFLAATRLAVDTGVNGTGIIAKVSFKTKAYGNTPLDLNETKLVDSTQPFGQPIPHEVIDGRVHVGLIDIAIINIQTPINVPKGNLALINVTVENQGRVNQTFDVTLFYDTTAINTQTVIDLTPAEIRILTFPWDTSSIPVGDYRIIAEATIAPGEIDTEDNTYNGGILYVGTRDIAITNTHPSKTVTNDTLVYINVSVTNNGEATAIFNLTANLDMNPIETKYDVNLPPGETTHLIFTLNTKPLPKGIYTISVTATTLPGETRTEDNTFTDGTITETLLGDVNGDFKVNIVDLSSIARAFGSEKGEPRWDPNADLDNNEKINIVDIFGAAQNFGKEI